MVVASAHTAFQLPGPVSCDWSWRRISAGQLARKAVSAVRASSAFSVRRASTRKPGARAVGPIGTAGGGTGVGTGAGGTGRGAGAGGGAGVGAGVVGQAPRGRKEGRASARKCKGTLSCRSR